MAGVDQSLRIAGDAVAGQRGQVGVLGRGSGCRRGESERRDGQASAMRDFTLTSGCPVGPWERIRVNSQRDV